MQQIVVGSIIIAFVLALMAGLIVLLLARPKSGSPSHAAQETDWQDEITQEELDEEDATLDEEAGV